MDFKRNLWRFYLWKEKSKTRQVGNGEGSLYYSDSLGRWIFQYYDTQGKRQTLKQRKKKVLRNLKLE